MDHTQETEVEALFARVKRELGSLNVLVNSTAGEDPLMAEWDSFWNANLFNGETIFRRSLLSHMSTAKHSRDNC